MNQLLLLSFCFITFTSIAQTKKIAFKSHNGSNKNFTIALYENLFDMDNSNFGNAPQRDVVSAQLDSVIFVSDSVALIVTSKYCKWQGQDDKEARLWNPGKEKMINHPLFSRKHSLDSIKKVIKKEYNFRNPVDEVVFVGYDNKKGKKRKNNELLVFSTPQNNDQSPFNGEFVFILSLIIILSLLGAFISWRYYQWKSRNFNNPEVILS